MEQWGTFVLEATFVLQGVLLHLHVPQVGLVAAATRYHLSSQRPVSC